jgi:hypothetical protein
MVVIQLLPPLPLEQNAQKKLKFCPHIENSIVIKLYFKKL